MNNNYLLEIGVEELPAKQITAVTAKFKSDIENILKKNELIYSDLKIYSTPRRISVLITDIADKLPDKSVKLTGPAESAPEQARLGFMKKNNLTEKDISIENGKITAVKNIIGKPSKELIGTLISEWITLPKFDKSMRWRDYDVMFSRPIRWIVSLWNNEILPVSIANVSAGNLSFGHRTLCNKQVEIKNATDYESALQSAYVIASPEKRKDMIISGINKITGTNGNDLDTHLLDEIINITEYPTVFTGTFEEEYLDLPEPLVVTPMKDHQRYFPIYENGKLQNKFIGVRNGDDFAIENVIKGNEKVLKARLEDASFFFAEDRKKPLSDYVQSLKTVIYQAKLGTIYDKVQRIDKLSQFIADYIKFDDKENLSRAVMLCKADLNTNAVGEFDELQGVIGSIYAKSDGENSVVSTAIESHYKPRFSGDTLPNDTIGAIISLADKVDSLVGSYGIGVMPKGNADPFGLRRMTIAIINILRTKLGVNLYDLLDKAIEILGDKIDTSGAADLKSKLVDSFKDRLKAISLDEGHKFDLIEATLPNSYCIKGYFKKLEIISDVSREKLAEITENLLRPIKLSKNHNSTDTKEVYDKDLIGEIKKSQGKEDVFEKLTTLSFQIAVYLEKNMVNDPNEEIKNSRLSLMKIYADAIGGLYDFTKLQF
ncbi:MAG: glycine--tRNA ligase subunit beta [Ruminococcus sp.]|jgi:glycyl-tRNA synthetase beta chain|nr:glycine--tRNA ligase subunit beta [Ruminococcus sp.]